MVEHGLTQEERLERFSSRLQDRRRGAPWYELAAALDEAVQGAASLGYGQDVITKLAAEGTGLSPGLVTRYISTYRRIQVAARAADVAPEVFMAPGFNPVEMAVRLYDRAPELGLESLKALSEGRIGGAEIRKLLSTTMAADRSVAAARSRAHRGRAMQLELIGRAVERARGGLLPKDSLLQRRPSLSYFRRDGLEVRDADGRCVCGLDFFVTAGEDAVQQFETAFPAALLLSTYFPRTYFVFSPNASLEASGRAQSAVETFEAPWIGVLRVRTDLTIEVLGKAAGVPFPDRTAQYETIRSSLSQR